MIGFLRRYSRQRRREERARELRSAFVIMGRLDAMAWDDATCLQAAKQLSARLNAVIAECGMTGDVVALEIYVDELHSLRI